MNTAAAAVARLGVGVKLGEFAKGKVVSTANSPYMSLTAYTRDGKASKPPAVVHVDGSSCLQTVSKTAKPFYHSLMLAFHARTGVPMILNNLFNTLSGEPIIESP